MGNCGSDPQQAQDPPAPRRKVSQKYALVPDNYKSFDQVTTALREQGLESSNLIIGIDFTKSNEWSGRYSFRNQSLHSIGDTPNPYEQVIAIIGKTLTPFDEDNLIPCFGFGDATTHDTNVFSFHKDHSPCRGFDEVLDCYRKIVRFVQLSGPTSLAPVIYAAVDTVKKTGGLYHVLVIVADGQVTRSINSKGNELSSQERETIEAIVTASSYPLSIVLVGVGDGPWDEMKKFDDKIPKRVFDNFQFVNFTSITSKNMGPSEKEAAFALAALMEVPIQYKAAMELGFIGRRTKTEARRMAPLPPPLPPTHASHAPIVTTSQTQAPINTTSNPLSHLDGHHQVCPICLTNSNDMAFGCGHMSCRDCAQALLKCPICRSSITSRLRLYPG